MTVLESIQRSTQFLAKKGVESPRLHSELILAHLLKLPRMQLYLNFERVLTAAEVASFRELIQRRGQREPLQHIVGSTCFCGLELSVDRRALVPRPETELLAERGLRFLREISRSKAEAPTVLDFGTGGGCVAITLASQCAAAQVYALDISDDALALAQANAQRQVLAQPIRFLKGADRAALPSGLRLDLLISNPPYIATSEIDTLEPEVRDYEPRQALDGGADGLNLYRYLAEQAGRWLKPGARLMVEFGDGQAEAIQSLFEAQKWIVEAVEPDYNQRPRILIARRE